jgi:hypothetical protein
MSLSERYRKLRGDVLFHYTHEDNMASIKGHDNMIFSCSQIIEKGITPSFITDSNSRNIDVRKGYNDYVFLVFSHSHPMIYRKSQEGIPLLYCSIDISILDIPGVLIADRVATDSSVTLYSVEDAIMKLDIKNCCTERVNDRDVWLNVRKYEILIPGYIDLKQYMHKQ